MSYDKCDLDAERAVIAGICQHGKDAILDVADIIDTSAFSLEEHKILYKCLDRVLEKEQSADITTIYSAANELKLYDTINNDEAKKNIRGLFNLPVKLDNVRSHAKKLMKLELIRAAANKHREAWTELRKLSGNETVPEILATSEAPIFDLLNSLSAGRLDIPQQIADGGVEYLEHLCSNPVDCIGIPTPWPRFNQAIGGGLTNGGVTLIAARPKKGKSSLGTNCAMHVAGIQKIPVLYLDTEMSRHQQLCRCLAYHSNVHVNEISTGKFGKKSFYKKQVFKANQILADMPYDHINIAGQDFDTILGIIRRWLFKRVGLQDDGKANPCLIVYDYFKLMSGSVLNKNMQEYQAMGFQISQLTDFAQKYDFPIMSFVQINRDGVSRDGSDVIAQSDRLLWLCHSLSIWKEKDAAEVLQTGAENGSNTLKVIDCRFGPGLADGDYINFAFNKSICKVNELQTNFEVLKNQGSDSGFELGEEDDEEDE